MTRLNVSMNDTLVSQLRRAVPTRQRSRFISDAVREKLVRLEQQRAVRRAAGAWSSEGRDENGPRSERQESTALLEAALQAPSVKPGLYFRRIRRREFCAITPSVTAASGMKKKRIAKREDSRTPPRDAAISTTTT